MVPRPTPPDARVVRTLLRMPCEIRIGAPGPPRTATLLITTFFPSAQHAHSNEIFAAIAQNLLNELIDEVHTLHEIEPGGGGGGGQGGRTVHGALLETAARHGRHIRPTVLDKLVVHPWHRQPTYLDLFRFASERLGRVRTRLVLLANADVVFDASLALAIRSPAFDSPCFGGYAFPVEHPEASNQVFTSWFGDWGVRRCASKKRTMIETGAMVNRCVPPGRSFDAFLFRAPLPRHVVANFSVLTTPEYPRGVVMNVMAAEHFAGAMFTLAGLVMLNPCRFVHVSHWHCTAKMHAMVRAPNGTVTSIERGSAAPWSGWIAQMSWFPPCVSEAACGMVA